MKKEDIENGIKIAKDAEVVIIFAKADSGEEDDVIIEKSIGDRLDLDLWYGGNELMEIYQKLMNK